MNTRQESQPRGWEGEGLPKEKGPGAGQPVPKLEERFPAHAQDRAPQDPTDLIAAQQHLYD